MNQLEEPVSWDEACPWIEFGCWVTLALTPFFCWIHGGAVSKDQFVMRCLLVASALIGGVGFRIRALRKEKRLRS